LAKCEFGKSEVKFVGWWGQGPTDPIPSGWKVWPRWNPPRTKKELRKLLGAIWYYREYIPHYSAIAQPLTDLTKKGVPNVLASYWSGDCQEA